MNAMKSNGTRDILCSHKYHHLNKNVVGYTYKTMMVKQYLNLHKDLRYSCVPLLNSLNCNIVAYNSVKEFLQCHFENLVINNWTMRLIPK